ncbi:MAG: chorismate--pyruvate lyase family protein [Burkholderiales bacterium]
MRSHSRRDSWKSALLRPTVPPLLYPWLTHRGSLTERLRAHCNHFQVKVLRQGLGCPFEDERALLGLRKGELAWIREVLLCDGETPLVFAHSVLPRSHVRGAWNLFAGLGARPLGEVIFTDPQVTRQALQFRQLSARHPLYQRMGTVPKAFHSPARRSLFYRFGRSLLVTEVFLGQAAPF